MPRIAAMLGVMLAACNGNHATPVADAYHMPDALILPATGVDLPLGSLDAFTYTVGQNIGTQMFTQIVDTGSTTMGVATTGCSGCGVTPLYMPGKTATNTMVVASTEYADMSGWSGDVYDDKVSLAGLPTVDQDFVAINMQTMFFDMNMYQGILGFSPMVNAEPNTDGFMDLEAAAGVPYEMAFRLCSTIGDMWLGGFDPSAATSPVQYTPMVPINGTTNPFYSVQIADMAFGNDDLNFTTADFGVTIVDTGTSISEVPPDAENAMLAIVNANTGLHTLFPGQTLADTETGDCVTTAGVTSAMVDAMMPPLVTSFPNTSGGSNFTLTVSATNSYMQPQGGGMFCWGFTSSGGPAATYGSLIGDTTLAGMLAVFDVANLQMGFAPEQGCVEAEIALHPNVVRPNTTTDHWFQQDPFYRPPPKRPF